MNTTMTTDHAARVKKLADFTNTAAPKPVALALTEIATNQATHVGYALEILTRVRVCEATGRTAVESSYVEAKTRTDCKAAAVAEVARLNSLATVVASRYVTPFLQVTKPKA